MTTSHVLDAQMAREAPERSTNPGGQSPLERVLGLLSNPQAKGRYYRAACPAHNGDSKDVLAIWEDGDDGHVCFKCFSHGCETKAICEALGIQQPDLYFSNGRKFTRRRKERKIDILDFAIDKNIDPRFLESCGITDGHKWKGDSVVRIPYYLADGSEYTQIRIRENLIAKKGSKWEGTGPLIPYGLNWLQEARDAGYCWIPEGESDCLTLRRYKIPALGIPGAGNEKVLQAGMLDSIPNIYIVSEPDQAGEKFPARVVKRLREIGYAGKIYTVSLHALYEAKDPNDLLEKLWRENCMSEFPVRMQAARDAAQLIEEETSEPEPDASTVIAEIEQAIKTALEAQDANAIYALVNRLIQVEKTAQARLKSLIRDGAKRCPGFSLHDFNGLLKDARSEQTRKEAEQRGHVTGKPQILLGRQLREESEDCLDALRKANERTPRLFVRGGKLSYIAQDEQKHSSIETMSEDALIAYLAEIADFVSYNQERDTYSSQHPTPRLAKTILASPQLWRFPALVGLTDIPVLRPDGTILDKSGYDKATRLYYQPTSGLALPTIPKIPTKLQAENARDFVFDFFSQFPYASDADRANAYGLVLSSVFGELFDLCPMALLDAAKPGTGKGFFVQAFSIICQGNRPASVRPSREEEEQRKRLTSALQAGRRVLNLDNLNFPLNSATLEQFLTDSVWSDRLLGTNQMTALDKRRVFVIATGNNLEVRGDLPRRCFRIHLNAGVSRPWERPIEYKHNPLLPDVQEHRGEILAALLTIARAWYLAGRPEADTRDSSDFARWKRVIGGVLAFLDIPKFLENETDFYEETSPEEAQWERFLQTWQTTIGRAVSVKELIELLDGEEAFRNTLPDQLARYYEQKERRRFGRVLATHRDMPYGKDNLHLTKGAYDTHAKQDTWQVIAAPTPPTDDEKPTREDCGINSEFAGLKKVNPACSSRIAEQPLEADSTPFAGLSGINFPVYTQGDENILFSDTSENKNKNKIFPYSGAVTGKLIPLNPANNTEPALEAGLTMRDELRDQANWTSFIPQSPKLIPQSEEQTDSSSEDAIREQFLAYGQAHDWPKLPVGPALAIPAGETFWRLYVTRHKLSEIVHALSVAERAGV